MISARVLCPRFGGGVSGCVVFSLIDIVGLGFVRLGGIDRSGSSTAGSAIRSRESTQVGGLCSIKDSETHHEPGRWPDFESDFSGTTKKQSLHIRPVGAWLESGCQLMIRKQTHCGR